MPGLGGIFKAINNLKQKCLDAVYLSDDCTKISQCAFNHHAPSHDMSTNKSVCVLTHVA